MITILVCSSLLARDACVEKVAFSVARTPVVAGIKVRDQRASVHRCERATRP